MESPGFGVREILDDAVRLELQLVQLCDLPALEDADDHWLQGTAAAARHRGLTLETGTKGIEVDHLEAHLHKAERLGSRLVRSMVTSPRGTPTLGAAVEQLRRVMPRFETAGVELALETYEQISSTDLVRIVEEVGSPNLGICLDPGNSVARLEVPQQVIATTAPYVRNIHVKDFAFTRKEGTIGFTFAGAELGQGLLDFEAMITAVTTANPGRKINQIIEHWLTKHDTLAITAALEKEWVDASVRWLRARTATTAE